MAHGWNNTKLSLNEGFENFLASPDENLTLPTERLSQEKDVSDNSVSQAIISSHSDTCSTTNFIQPLECHDSGGKIEGVSLSPDPQLEICRGHLQGKSCTTSDVTVELGCLIHNNEVFGGCVNSQNKTDLLDQYSDVSSCSELDNGTLAEFEPENNCYEPEGTQNRCNFNSFKTPNSSNMAGSLEWTSQSENVCSGNDLNDVNVTASVLSSFIDGPHKDKEQENHALVNHDAKVSNVGGPSETMYDTCLLRETKESQNLECTSQNYPDCHVNEFNSLLVSAEDSGSVDGADMKNMIPAAFNTANCETDASNRVLETCLDFSETLSSKSSPQEPFDTNSVNMNEDDGKKLKDDVLGIIKGGEGPGSGFEFLERCLDLSNHTVGPEQKLSPSKESLNGIATNISDTTTGEKTVLTIQDNAPLPLVQLDLRQVAADENTEQTLPFFSQSGEDSLHAPTSDDPSASVFEKVKCIGTTAANFSSDRFNKQLMTQEPEQIGEHDLARLISHDLKQLLHPVVLLKCSRQNVAEKNRYHCSKCQATASSLSQLIKHHHLAHSSCNFHFCQSCSCCFTNEKLAKQHLCSGQVVKPTKNTKKQSFHKSYNCRYCNLTFNKLYEYHKHERIHTGTTPFKCEKCGLYFSQSASLNRHKRLGRCRVAVSQDSSEKSNGQISQHTLKAQELSSSSMSAQLPSCFVKLVDFRKEELKSEKHEAFDKGFQLGALVSHQSLDSDRRFKCHNCKKAFRHSSNLSRHKKKCRIGNAKHQTTFLRHLKNFVGQYKCPLCPRVFKYSYNRFRHMQVQCLKDFSQQLKGKRASVYRCALCTRTFANSSNRNRHIRMVCMKQFIHRENLKVKRDFQDQRESLQHQLPAQTQQSDGLHHKCNLCPAIFAHSSGKYKHMTKHKLFEKTGKTFRYRNSVPISLNPETEDILRFRDKNDDTGNFHVSCHYCGKNFNSSSTLKKHTKLHKGERPYCCLECGKRFLRNSHLIAHKKVHQRRIQCTVCKKIVPTIGELIKHRKTHINKGMLQCPDCPLQFKYPAFFLRHLSKHSSMQQNPVKEENCSPQQKELQQEDGCDEFKCHLCQEVFDSAKMLNQHCLSHMPAHSTKQCPFCKRHFSNRPGLVRHIRLHTGEKPYRCHGCGKCFSRNEPLKTHQEKCTGEINKQHITPTPETAKKYSCKYCPQTFVWPCSLSKHQKNHILKVLFPCSKCGKCYKKLKLMSHEKICDPSAAKYTDTSTTTLLTCAKCGQTFYRKSNQVVHERKCTGARSVLPGNVALKNSKCLSSKSMDKLKYRCLHCPKTFRYRCYLHRHLVAHARDKQHSCMHCGHRYSSYSRYLHHEAFCDGIHRYRGSINITNVVRREQPSLETISEEKTINITKAEAEGEYKCKFCNKTFMRARNLRHHILTHTGVKPYHCKTCQSCFSRYDHLKVHQYHCKGKKRKLEVRIVKISLEDLEKGWKKTVEKPQEMQMFECNSCSKRFTTRANLARHVAILHTTIKPFSCNYCTTSFSHLSSLKKHDLKCKEKMFSVLSRASSEEHNRSNSMRDTHIIQPCHETSEIIKKIQKPYPDNRKFFCTYCPRRFKTQEQLKVHTRLHTGEKPFGCASCGERFIRRDYLKRHLIKCSFGPERIERLLCEMCGELFSSQELLQNHLKNCVVNPKSPETHPTTCSTTSSKIKGFSCTNCSQRFLLFSQLQQHFLTMHREDNSHQLINSASSLNQQMASSANVKEEPADEGYRENELSSYALFSNELPTRELGDKKACICPHCNIQFRNNSGLGMHLRIHSGRFSFSCPRCKKGFWSKNSLRKHHRKCRNLQIVPKEESDTETVPFLVSSKGTNTVLVFNSGSKATGTGVLQTEFSCKEGNKDSHPNSSDVQEKQKTFGKKDGTTHKYQCPECGQSFTDGLLLISHLEEHNRQKQEEKQGHFCRVCDKVFKHPAVLHRHLKMQHKMMPYLCPECPKSFRYPSDLDAHRYCHDPNRPFICNDCGLRFWSITSLKRHSSAVHQKILKSVGMYTCRKCDKTFPDRRCYQKHWKRKHYKAGMGHNKPKRRFVSSEEVELSIGGTEIYSDDDSDDSDSAPYFPCHVCGKSFTTSESLEDHQRCHLGEKPHECGECGKCFFQLAHLQHHQRSHKSEFQCQTCGRGFVSLFALRKHKHSHGKSRPYRCPRCQLSFTGPIQLAEHMTTHRDDNFPCDLCDRTFSCRLSRAQHRMTHTEPEESLPPLLPPADTANSLSSPTLIPLDADQLKYHCGICNKRFRDAEQLSEHGCYAGRERPYSCTECNQHFLQGSHLKKHQLSHPLSKAYSHQCHLCHMTFSYRHQYLSHLKGHGVQESEDSPSKKSTTDYSLSNSENLYQSPGDLHSFPRPVELADHLPVNAENILVCETCGETFASESNLMEHEQCHLTTSTQYECTECGNSFLGSNAFRQHLCARQKRTVANTDNLMPSSALHMTKALMTPAVTLIHPVEEEEIEVDVGEDFYNCPVCDKRFSSKLGLEQHQQQHVPDHRFKCLVCGKFFAKKRYLKKHELIHRVYQCRICHQTFDSAKGCVVHQEQHNDTQRYQCPVCLKNFVTLHDLSHHKKTHNERPDEIGGELRCDMCCKSFSQLSLLQQHQETHVGQVVYECTECDKAFAFFHLLEQHQSTHSVVTPSSVSSPGSDLSVSFTD